MIRFFTTKTNDIFVLIKCKIKAVNVIIIKKRVKKQIKQLRHKWLVGDLLYYTM